MAGQCIVFCVGLCLWVCCVVLGFIICGVCAISGFHSWVLVVCVFLASLLFWGVLAELVCYSGLCYTGFGCFGDSLVVRFGWVWCNIVSVVDWFVVGFVAVWWVCLMGILLLACFGGVLLAGVGVLGGCALVVGVGFTWWLLLWICLLL